MYKVIDLSFPIYEGMQTFSSRNHPFTEISQLARHGIENRETRKITIGSHTGTHIDAPRHFIPNGNTIDKINLDHLVGDFSIADLKKIKKKNINSEILESKLGSKPKKRILLNFGWDINYGKSNYYRDSPFLDKSACQWLIKKKCALLGMDIPSPDNPINNFDSDNDSPNHKILLGKKIIIVEYMTKLDKLINIKNGILVIAPLNILYSDGSPSRAFAIIKK